MYCTVILANVNCWLYQTDMSCDVMWYHVTCTQSSLAEPYYVPTLELWNTNNWKVPSSEGCCCREVQLYWVVAPSSEGCCCREVQLYWVVAPSSEGCCCGEVQLYWVVAPSSEGCCCREVQLYQMVVVVFLCLLYSLFSVLIALLLDIMVRYSSHQMATFLWVLPSIVRVTSAVRIVQVPPLETVLRVRV